VHRRVHPERPLEVALHLPLESLRLGSVQVSQRLCDAVVEEPCMLEMEPRNAFVNEVLQGGSW
jgi:hypothetical protein